MRKFNVTGLCIATEHYMADIGEKLSKIKKMVDNGNYFTINKARQYGKTTILACLEKFLPNEYITASISFEGIGDESFVSPDMFCPMLLRQISKALEFSNASAEYANKWLNNDAKTFELLSDHITKMCKDHIVVLMIDESDKASNNKLFLTFLGMLRNKFLLRAQKKDFTFQSVILAGVYDIRNIKMKMMGDGNYPNLSLDEKKYNSPWNIAVDFEVDMSLNPAEIATMLAQYESDHNTGMDIKNISSEIYGYTSGYPYLVSRLCQHIDGKLNGNWSSSGVSDALRVLIHEDNTLFDDLTKNMENNKGLYNLLQNILFNGNFATASTRTPEVQLGLMYGILDMRDGQLCVSNMVFETIIYDYIVQKNRADFYDKTDRYYFNSFIANGCLDMPLVMRKFAEFMQEEYREADIKFIEQHGRLVFLSFLKPIINGSGFALVEPQTRQNKRMDIVVTFGKKQYIIELKIWYGESSHMNAYDQLLEYMDIKGQKEGYLLTFDFRKDVHKQSCAEWVTFDDKRIFDVVV